MSLKFLAPQRAHASTNGLWQLLTNETKPQLSLHVVTPRGECGYLADLSSGPVGADSTGVFVNGMSNFKLFGGFEIQEASCKIVVRNDKIIAMGSCYPSC